MHSQLSYLYFIQLKIHFIPFFSFKFQFLEEKIVQREETGVLMIKKSPVKKSKMTPKE